MHLIKEKTRQFNKLINKVRRGSKVKGDIKIYFIDDKYMRRLNKQFRGVDRTTDVLSFEIGDSKNLGEIVISEKQAKIQAKRFKLSLKKEIDRLVVHGVLHLLGYDHKKSKERNEMIKLEERYLKWAV